MTALALLTASGSAAAATGAVDSPHGSSAGVVTASPEWSLGLQAGNYGSSGVVMQGVGIYGGAVNVGLGLAYNGVYLSGDYLVLLSEAFHVVDLPDGRGYNAFRGQLNPYLGAGLQVGHGLVLRIPVGVQYTMSQDPFNFFGGVTLMIGRFFADHAYGPQLWFNLGARILL